MTLNHPALGIVRYETVEVSEDPQEQVEQVISMMRRHAVEDSRSPVLRADLQQALGYPRPGSMTDEDAAAAIFHHVKSRVTFAQDEKTAAQIQGLTDIPIAEAFIRPVDMAGMCNQGECSRVGDCDDYAMYAASLLLAAGIPCAYVTVAADPVDPSRFSHVYVAAYPGSGRMPLDTSHGQYPGWETGTVFARREWPLDGGTVCRLFPWLLAGVAGWLVIRSFKSSASSAWRSVWA